MKIGGLVVIHDGSIPSGANAHLENLAKQLKIRGERILINFRQILKGGIPDLGFENPLFVVVAYGLDKRTQNVLEKIQEEFPCAPLFAVTYLMGKLVVTVVHFEGKTSTDIVAKICGR